MTRPIENHEPRNRNEDGLLDYGSQLVADEESKLPVLQPRRDQRWDLRDWKLTYESDQHDDESHSLSARDRTFALVGFGRKTRYWNPEDAGFRQQHFNPNLLQPLDSSPSAHPMRIRRRSIAMNLALSKGVDDREPSEMYDHRGWTTEVTRVLSARGAHEEDDGSDEEDDGSDEEVGGSDEEVGGSDENADESIGDDDAEGVDGAQEASHKDKDADGESTAALAADETKEAENNKDSESNSHTATPTNEAHDPSNQSKGTPTTPNTSDTASGSHVTPACGGTICQLGLLVSTHIILSSLAAVTLALLCYWRLKLCCSRRRVDHGEYRMVTAQYVDSAFDESLSDDEGSDDENFDGGWSKSGKRTIEMHSIDRERNGGLTLEEMNG
jgi:hypothetical protein